MQPYRFIDPKNSVFDLLYRMCLSTNSIASFCVNGCCTLRIAVMRSNSTWVSSSSSLCVPDMLMHKQGKMHFPKPLRW